MFASVIVAVLARVENSGQGPQGGVGDLGEHGGLAAGLVPQDLDVEGVQQPGLQLRREAGQDVPGEGELVEQGGVGGLRGGGGQGVELLAFVVQVGEPGADPAAQGRGGGVGRVGGELLEFEDAGVLGGLDLTEPGPDGGGAPPKLWAIIDEAAARRQVGGRPVMAAQLARLQEAAGQPNITIQVIPFDAGAHPGMDGSFVVLDFPDPADRSIIYTESAAGGLFLDEEDDIRRYTLMFGHLRAAALRPQATAAALAAIAAPG